MDTETADMLWNAVNTLTQALRLTDVNAVAPHLGGEIGAVVEEKGCLARLDDRAQDIARLANVVVRDILQAQLHGSDVTGIERLRHHRRKRRRVQARRRDQIQPAAHHRSSPGRQFRRPSALTALASLAEEDVDDAIEHRQRILAWPLERVAADDLAVAAAIEDVLRILVDRIRTLHGAA